MPNQPTNVHASPCMAHSDESSQIKSITQFRCTNSVELTCFQCFNTVGWAAGRASGL